MAQIEVNPGELPGSAKVLDAIGDDLGSCRHHLKELRPGEIGAGNIVHALHRFADQWEYGMERMVESVKRRRARSALPVRDTPRSKIRSGRRSEAPWSE